MKEIETNKKAWGLLAEDHYKHCKKLLLKRKSILKPIILKELGDISGKSIIHLQCNAGADTISLANKGAIVTGVDLAPQNIFYAKKLAQELKTKNITFIESDILKLDKILQKKFDIVFTSEGAIGWLPDLNKWGKIIRKLLKDNGFFYALDSHPFYLMFDEKEFRNNKLTHKYPYFIKKPEFQTTIGGYFSSPKTSNNYFWMYTISEIINSLCKAGLYIEFFNEYNFLYYNEGGMKEDKNHNWYYPFFNKKIPYEFSLKARVRK